MPLPSPNPIPNNAIVKFDYFVTSTIINSSSEQSNTVNSQVNLAAISSSKSVNKTYANVGDILVYTITLANNGNVTATNILFLDTIPLNTSIIGGSFNQDGNIISGSPVPPGVVLPNSISPGAISTVTFNLAINAIPSPNPISNTATTNFSFLVDPVSGRTNTLPSSSNSANTKVNNANLSVFSKIVDKTSAVVGDNLTYNVVISNTGNTTATNVHFIDTISNATSLVTNSVILNGSTQNGFVVSPPTGVTIGNINPLSTVTLSFKLQVDTIPSPNPISNTGIVNYSYTVDPVLGTSVSNTNISNTQNTQIYNPDNILNSLVVDFDYMVTPTIINSGSATSNITASQFNLATISSTKVASIAYADIGDIIVYTITLANNGNITADNILFIDTIPNDTSIVGGSFKQDNIVVSGSPNPPGVMLPNVIGPGFTSTVTFSVVVLTIPSPNPIPNNVTSNYSFLVDPNTGRTVTIPSSSNTVTTQINHAQIGTLSKDVDKSIAQIGDFLNYTITIGNTGNTTATNVNFIDTIPNGTVFVPNSVILNGAAQNGFTVAPPTGVTIGNIGAGAISTVAFKLQVISFPTPNPIPNIGVVNFGYTVDPVLGTSVSSSTITNTTTTQIINSSSLNLDKSSAQSIVSVGDAVDYTVSLSNTGNATLTNIVFIDTIPSGTHFIPDSLYLNTVQQFGASPAPPNGFNVGTIAPGNISTLTFQLQVDTVPSPNPFINNATSNYNIVLDPVTGTTAPGSSNSNPAYVYVKSLYTPIKSLDKPFVVPGDIITYTVVWQNVLDKTETNLYFFDTIPNGTSFISNSVSVNGTTIPGATVTLPNGLSLGNLNVGNVFTITFEVLVDSITSVNTIPNQAMIQYTFQPSLPNVVIFTDTLKSNIVTSQVNYANLSGVTKYTNKNYTTCGEIITYTISIPNSGTVTATNVVLRDTIPNQTSLIDGSITVNGAVQPSGTNPQIGVTIGTIPAGSVASVSFQVVVIC